MAEGVLGLGQGQAASLNQDLIDRLKAAEKKATVDVIETNIENITKEKETFANIQTKIDEFLAVVKPFDLFVSGGVNAFDQKAASTSGTSVTFDAADAAKLNTGVTKVDIQALAQKDVFQSDTLTAAQKDSYNLTGDLVIKVGDETHTFNTADYTSYEDLAKAIDNKAGINASFDQVGNDSYRLVLKSQDSGTANALEISGAASTTLGYTTDGTTIKDENHILKAQDMKALVDGVEYNVSSNELTVDGLKIKANSLGESSINISNDTAALENQINEFVAKYNELVGLIDGEISNADSDIEDKSALRDVLSQIKNKIFGTYGENSDKSIFNVGFELDKNGLLSVDSTKLKDAIENDPEGLKELFIGTAAKEGLGTQLKATIDELKFTGGTLSTYESTMTRREETLKEDKKIAEERLDSKYQQLAAQFGSYGAIINQFEAEFSGLKLMIQQSTAS